jgi:hypothetical protein
MATIFSNYSYHTGHPKISSPGLICFKFIEAIAINTATATALNRQITDRTFLHFIFQDILINVEFFIFALL